MTTPFDEQDGISRSISETPPTHYTFKIQLFSLLAKNNVNRYESSSFEAGGYKWKLVLHPNGNENKNVKEHISIYLAMAEGATSLPPGWEVYATFHMFLLDQNKDNYLTLEDTSGNGKRFHGMKLEWGFDRFIPLKVFGDATNGYLVDDCCVFGAEVFVCKERTKGKVECLTMIKDAITHKHSWKIEKYSESDAVCYKEFYAGDQQWKMKLHRYGNGSGTGSHISLYLVLADPSSLPPASKIFAEFTLRILNQTNAKHHFGKASYWFSGSSEECGWARFILLSWFQGQNSGFLIKDSCSIEAEVTVLGLTNALV